MDTPTDVMADSSDANLFQLASIKSKKQMYLFDEGEFGIEPEERYEGVSNAEGTDDDDDPDVRANALLCLCVPFCFVLYSYTHSLFSSLLSSHARVAGCAGGGP